MKVTEHLNVDYFPGVTEDATRKVDIYIPVLATEDSVDSSLPELLIYIHGGCWRSGDKNDFVNLGRAIAGKTYTDNTNNKKKHLAVAIINYRLSKPNYETNENKHPIQLIDTIKSIEFLISNSKRFGYDGQNTHLVGHSAGGHLSGLICLDPPKSWATDKLPGMELPTASCIKSITNVAGIFDHGDLVNRHPEYLEFTDQTFGSNTELWNAFSPQYAPFSGFYSDLISKSLAQEYQYDRGGEPLLHVRYLVFHSLGDELMPVAHSTRYADHIKSLGIDTSVKADQDFGTHFGALETQEFYDFITRFIFKL
ncbi:Kynurenine formamidase [Smittium culicis]|uniref:Kynurenine formamidase n=1 Tax=Smittium culicis TaxID=133412 RepID=A0A1R1YGL1_9FUNG|nr:Kynurenine formamidase [Smittium culicis]